MQADLLVSAGGQTPKSVVMAPPRPCTMSGVVRVSARPWQTMIGLAESYRSCQSRQDAWRQYCPWLFPRRARRCLEGKGSDSRHLGQRIGRENDLRSNSLFQRHGACCPATTVLLSAMSLCRTTWEHRCNAARPRSTVGRRRRATHRRTCIAVRPTKLPHYCAILRIFVTSQSGIGDGTRTCGTASLTLRIAS